MSDPPSPLPFLALPNLASARFGARAVAANDEFFAGKENLVADSEPVWDAERYTDRGKWMDGWETRRRRQPGHDWCLVELAMPGVVEGVVVDTAHFKGNYPESCEIQGCWRPGASADDVLGAGTEWLELLARTPLAGDARQPFAVGCPYAVTHVRLVIHPDGGVARLRVHGRALPRPGDLAAGDETVLTALHLGARVVAVSDAFFGSADKLLLADEPRGMHDGWETRRRRGPGHDWAVVRLACAGIPRRLEVDTAFFKGNAPGEVSVEAFTGDVDAVDSALHGDDDPAWQPLLARTPVEPDRQHVFDDLPPPTEPATYLRLRIYPDGGVARFRAIGAPDLGACSRAALDELNHLPPAEAEKTFRDCCASRRWSAHMAAARPYATLPGILDTAAATATSLERDDWLEAFSGHPEIGGDRPDNDRGERSAAWSRNEQKSVEGAGDEIFRRFADGNRRYRERFGHPFIVCATDKSPEEMLAALEERLENDPDEELAAAAAEELAITRLRLEKLLQP